MSQKITYPKFTGKAGKRTMTWNGTADQAMTTLHAMQDRHDKMIAHQIGIRRAGLVAEYITASQKSQRYLDSQVLPFAAFTASLYS